MGLALRLVETGADTRGHGIDILAIDLASNLCDAANLGLTPCEAKQLLIRVQQAVAAVQARDHAALRPECSICGATCHEGLAVASDRETVRHHGCAAAAVPLPGMRAQRGRSKLAGAPPLHPGAGSAAV